MSSQDPAARVVTWALAGTIVLVALCVAAAAVAGVIWIWAVAF